MVLVQTNIGMIPRDRLVVEDLIHDTDDARVIQTSWKLDGVEVRRDATVSILRGQSLMGAQHG